MPETNAHLSKVALGGGIDAVTLGEFVHHGEEGVQVRRRVGGRPRLLLLFEGPSGYLSGRELSSHYVDMYNGIS